MITNTFDFVLGMAGVTVNSWCKVQWDFGDYKGEIIDCAGLCIAPGFIDAHSHNDFYTMIDDNLKYFLPFVEQGITSIQGTVHKISAK